MRHSCGIKHSREHFKPARNLGRRSSEIKARTVGKIAFEVLYSDEQRIQLSARLSGPFNSDLSHPILNELVFQLERIRTTAICDAIRFARAEQIRQRFRNLNKLVFRATLHRAVSAACRIKAEPPASEAGWLQREARLCLRFMPHHVYHRGRVVAVVDQDIQYTRIWQRELLPPVPLWCSGKEVLEWNGGAHTGLKRLSAER